MKIASLLQRHRWSQPSRPSELRSERTCTLCGVVRVTRHDGALYPWTEFLDADRVLLDSHNTPPCRPSRCEAAA